MQQQSKSIKKRAKTFFWASLFFSKSQQKDISILYSFCRYVDDITDTHEFTKIEAKKKLESVKKDLKSFKSKNPLINNFIQLKNKKKIDLNHALELINGAKKDLTDVNLKNIDELIIYSYQVAGTVGLMMCSLMNITEKKLLPHAIELGIAMQFTNISRDVKEDLEMKRIYLPNSFRSFNFSSYKELLYNKEKKKLMITDTLKLINYSNKIYESSMNGILKLPFKYKLPILIASRLYQNIGFIILKKSKELLRKRIYVSGIKKIYITFSCIFFLLFRKNSDQSNFTYHKEVKIILSGYLKKYDKNSAYYKI
tara:strand:+ start:525 stop:1457 length:933 start_codon:yes stop_codon:yes gene_type:complete